MLHRGVGRHRGGAVGICAGAINRRAWRPALLLGLLIGLSGGVVIGALLAAERVEHAYDTLLEEVDAPDLLAFTFDDTTRDELNSLPTVRRSAGVLVSYPILRTADGRLLGPFEGECETGPGELSTMTLDDPTVGSPVRLLTGRLPSPGASDEIAVATSTLRRAGAAVGDTIYVNGTCHDDGSLIDAPIPVRVVGEFVGILDVRTPGQDTYFEFVVVDREFLARLGPVDEPEFIAVWMHDGSDRSVLPDALSYETLLDVEAHARSVEAGLQPDATALRILALAVAATTVIIVMQLLSRHLRAVTTDHRRLRILGMSTRQLWTVGMLHAALVAAAGAATAVLVALALVPRLPPGSAEDMLRGTSGVPSLSTLFLGSAACIALVLLLAGVPAWLATRPVRAGASRSRLAALFGAADHLGTARAWGMRVALEPRSGTSPAAVRSGLGALVVAGAVLVGVVTYTAGLQHLRETPRLGGWNWDVVIVTDDPQGVAAALEEHPGIDRVGRGTVFPHQLSVSGELTGELSEISLSTGPDSITPTVTEGRAPEGDDEILLGQKMADQLDARIGDEVRVLAPAPLNDLRAALGMDAGTGVREVGYELVGIGPVGFFGALDQGAAFTSTGIVRAVDVPPPAEIRAVLAAAEPEALAQLFVELELEELAAAVREGGSVSEIVGSMSDEQISAQFPDAEPHAVFVDAVDRSGLVAAVEQLMGTGMIEPDAFIVGANPDGSLQELEELVSINLDDTAWVPVALGFTMALALLAVLAHLVSSGARARRRDLAILRALGFTSRHVRRVISWQGATMAVVAGALSIVLGVIGGRIAWQNYAEGLGMVPEAVTPWRSLAVLIVAFIIAGLVVALVPGLRAARERPGAVLRSE